eukprot:8301-Amphidinium_carterae.1
MANWEFAIIHSAIWLIIFMRWYSLVSQDEVEARQQCHIMCSWCPPGPSSFPFSSIHPADSRIDAKLAQNIGAKTSFLL